MTWVAAAVIGGSVVGAGASIYGSNQAADATNKASKRAIDAQMQMYQQGRADLAPYRYAGYGALDQISALYGLPGGGSGYSAWQAQYGQPISVKAQQPGGGGGSAGGAALGGLGGFALGGPIGGLVGGALGGGLLGGSENTGPNKYFGGVINPLTGMVDVEGKDSKVDTVLTDYLRTGVWDPNNVWEGHHEQKYGNLRSAIDKLRGSGWTWEQAQKMAAGSTGDRQADAMSKFFTSPQYEWNRSEGLRGLEQSAAARGGAFSGTAIRGSQNLASNLASGEFNSYVDRLFNIAGLGNSSSAASANMAQNTGGNLASIYQNQGNARASSYLTGATGVNNAVQGGLQNYAFYNYLQNQPRTGG